MSQDWTLGESKCHLRRFGVSSSLYLQEIICMFSWEQDRQVDNTWVLWNHPRSLKTETPLLLKTDIVMVLNLYITGNDLRRGWKCHRQTDWKGKVALSQVWSSKDWVSSSSFVEKRPRIISILSNQGLLKFVHWGKEVPLNSDHAQLMISGILQVTWRSAIYTEYSVHLRTLR